MSDVLASAGGVASRSNRLQLLAVIACLTAGCAALLLTAPTGGNFWWSDAPRHALNGAFIKDLIIAMPWRDPKGWAISYYLQYPALTILFYPPLFYFVEAGLYAVIGISNFAAQLTVTLFTLVLAFAAYGLARMVFPRWSALGLALLAIGAPEVAFWGRQVMLDIPAIAMLVSGAFFFAQYLECEQPRSLALCTVFVLAAIYIKLNAVFIAPVLLAVLLITKGFDRFTQPHVIWTAFLGTLAMIPAILMTVWFGSANVESIQAIDGALPITSFGAWSYYAKLLPGDLGYATCVLAVIGAVVLVFQRNRVMPRWLMGLLLGWFGFDYVFVSAIAVREPRHGLMMLLPLMFLAVAAIHALVPQRIAQAVALALGAGTLVYSLIFYAPPKVDGYEHVVNYVAKNAPKDALVLFSGYRDGNFVFDLRTHSERRDIATMRADKLLLDVRVGERVRGVREKDYDETAIAKMLRDIGISLIVYQDGFWDDLRQMQRLASVVHGQEYRRVASFGITGGEPTERKIDIYQPNYAVRPRTKNLVVDMPIIGDQFKGQP